MKPPVIILRQSPTASTNQQQSKDTQLEWKTEMLDSTDNMLLNLIQTGFPLQPEPYRELGLKLSIDGDEVIRRIEQLKTDGIIRQIGPVMDSRRLGYRTTLVAMRVADTKLDKAAQLLVEHPGVSHGYERDHHFNLWFTLAIPPGVDMDRELEQMTRTIGAESAFALPAIKLFKIRAYFAMGGDSQISTDTTSPAGSMLPQEVELSVTDRKVINELQQDLPLIPSPFSAMAARLNLEGEDFLSQCRSLLKRGVIRRFSASVNHRNAGFTANAMTCWIAPAEKVDAAGQKLASLREVSHCYERKTNPQWRHNLFAMIHGRSGEICREIAGRVSSETGLTDQIFLFSTREFKKTRVIYKI
ncbi:Lrp/AsnC family transcriptional regulator [Chloroflexota bacterium]